MSEPADAARGYLDRVRAIFDTCMEEEAGAVAAAARLCANALSKRGLVYVFGSGHSHMLCEEAFFRAGGLARVCPMLVAPHMLHEGAVRSTRLEREPGHGAAILSRYAVDASRDCLVVASNSGANALPVEVARLAGERGVPVIAITSVAYSRSVRRPGPRLADAADVVIDNHCPPGDALVRLDGLLPPMGPASTVIGAALLNAVLVAAAAGQVGRGDRPSVYLSSNMPGAAEHNEALVAELSPRIPHL